MTKRRSQFPWRAEDSIIWDSGYKFVADTCWNAPARQSGRHTPTAHAHCIARAKYIVEQVNTAQERK